MRGIPTGTVTLLFTDVEGSTGRLHELGAERYADALAEHRRIVRQACTDEGGVEIDTQGDAFFVAFREAEAAARAAGAMSEVLSAKGAMRVRIGLHTGRPMVREEGYIGEDVHLGARIAAAGHGGQVLLSQQTREALADTAAVVKDLGEHRLKDIPEPIPIFQLGDASFPPLKTISNTNLPRPADSFIGREAEIADIVARIHSRDRLITLAGPGGTGKTRLAIEAAASLLGEFKAGVFWVDLVPVRDPDAVSAAVAATLTTEQDLAAHIGEREMLLVLDNLEHVIDAAPWVGSLVRECPNLSVLVTSRERMRVRGENLVEVPPLAETESSRLFADRAGIPVSPDVEELCARLEHLPLAIELAAARAASLTPRQILDRLGQRLDLLKGGRDADARQRTLRATIDWSHGLLNEDEQRLFRRLSVFAGGSTLEGVEEVTRSDLDTLESLVSKSLVRFAHGRYTMLETVRQYATEQLNAAGEGDPIRASHAAFVRDMMAAGIPALQSGGDDERARQLTDELGNVQGAFAWLVESGDAARAAAFIDTVWWYLSEFLSQHRIGLAMCETVQAMAGLTDGDRALIRHREGNFAMSLGQRDRAREAWTDVAAIARRIGDTDREGTALNNLAISAPDPAEAVSLFERSVELRPPKDERDRNRLRWNLAGLKERSGDGAAAEAIYAEILEWAARVGDYQYMAAAERELGERSLWRGDAAEALERAVRSRELAAGRGHAVAMVVADCLRCQAEMRLERDEDAARSLSEALEQLQRGDLESEDEVTAGALLAAAELTAAVGDRELAGRLSAVRRAVMQNIPKYPGVERAHEEWLAAHGVVPSSDPVDADVGAALEMIRDWLRDRR